MEISDDSRGGYNSSQQVNFINSMLKSSLCGYSDAYLFVNGTITIQNTGKAGFSNYRKNIIIQNCAPFTNCISEKNNIQIDNVKDIDVAMPIYNLAKYSDNY